MEASSLQFTSSMQDDHHYQSSADSAHLKIVVPGDYIAEGSGLTAGHGTFEAKSEDDDGEDLGTGKIYASVAGVVHKIDNWIGVKPLKQGYKPDVGDVVVGRIVAVQKSSWTVDVNSY